VSETVALPPLPDHPTVSAFMPARDAGRTIGAAIESIRAQDPPVGEIVVALGPSVDASAAILDDLARREPLLRVIDNPSGRIPDGLNAAYRATTGQVLIRVDAHSVLPRRYVATVLRGLRATGAANIGGVQRPVAEEGFARAVATAMASTLGSGGATYRMGDEPGPADTVFLGNFRREALDAIGGYDHRFDRNEDAELNIRLRNAGYLVWFTPDLVVDYRPRGDLPALARQYFANGRWRRLTSRVHPGSAGPRQLLPSLTVLGLAGSSALALGARRAMPALPVAAYAAALGINGWRTTGGAGDALAVAAALATMHLSFGAGFLLGPPNSYPASCGWAGRRRGTACAGDLGTHREQGRRP
jgi:succinoglycan biosynthesis protein ExoA